MLRLSGDDVTLLIFVEVHESLDGDVVGFRGAGGEEELFRIGVDQIGDLGAGGFDGGFRFPAKEVGTGVGVAESMHKEGEHGVEDARVDRGGRLHVKVKRSAGELDALDDGGGVGRRAGHRCCRDGGEMPESGKEAAAQVGCQVRRCHGGVG